MQSEYQKVLGVYYNIEFYCMDSNISAAQFLGTKINFSLEPFLL